jgi:hypothetical protein
MGREVRRVPLDFDWPLKKVWDGFLMPEELHEVACAECDQRGSTAARRWVEQIANLLLMLDDDLRAQARGQGIHPYLHDTGSYAWNVRPSPDIADFGEGLAGRAPGFLGHDAIDHWSATKKVIEAAGLDPEQWGICPACGGHGSIEKYEGQRAEADAWEPAPLPAGEGWQLWETTSEGSPVSPVFSTPEELARHIGGEFAKTLEWVTGPGWAPSGIITGGTVLTAEDITKGATP